MASTEVIDFVADLTERGMWFSVRGPNQDKLWVHPRSLYRELSREHRDFIRDHRGDLLDIASAVQRHREDIATGEPRPVASPDSSLSVFRTPTPIVEPDPEVFAYGYRIREVDVREAMRAMGDEMLDDYVSGRISKATAYQMAARGLRQSMEMKRARPVTNEPYQWRER
jgi:hypothetical protein